MHVDATGGHSPTRALDDRLRRGIRRPVVRRGGDALGGEHGGAGWRVDLLVVVQLDDLGGLEVGRGELGEADHQHRADGEVRCDDRVGLRRVEAGPEVVDVGGGEPGRADDRVDVVVRAPDEGPAGGVDDGEVDHDLGLGVGQGVEVRRDLHAGRVEHRAGGGRCPRAGDRPRRRARARGRRAPPDRPWPPCVRPRPPRATRIIAPL